MKNVEVIKIQYYAGLDIHKKTCQAIVCTEKGTIVKQAKIPTEKDKIQEFFSEFDTLTVTIEACNTWVLLTNGIKVLMPIDSTNPVNYQSTPQITPTAQQSATTPTNTPTATTTTDALAVSISKSSLTNQQIINN